MMSFVGISPTFQSHHSSSLAENCCIWECFRAFDGHHRSGRIQWWGSVSDCLHLCVCLSVSSSVYFPDCLFALFTSLPVCQAFCLLVCMYVCTTCLSSSLSYVFLSVFSSVWLSVRLSVCLIVYLFVWLSVWLSICLSGCLSICLIVYLYVCLVVCTYAWSSFLLVRLSVCLPVCLFICHSLFPPLFPGIIVKDCLIIMHTMLVGNNSNQALFREARSVHM